MPRIMPINKANIYQNNSHQSTVGNKNNAFKQTLGKNNVSFKAKSDAPIGIFRTVTNFIKNKRLENCYKNIKSMGVEDLKIGDNIELAVLLESAISRVKELRYDVPKIIKCESEIFNTEKEIQVRILTAAANPGTKIATPGIVVSDFTSEPILYLNTDHEWKRPPNLENINSKTQDMRHAIWHEVGHVLLIKNYKYFPPDYAYLKKQKLNSYEKDIVKETIGNYAAEEPITEAIAEIFARLMSGESYDKLHPEIFNVYGKYRGPMPKRRPK